MTIKLTPKLFDEYFKMAYEQAGGKLVFSTPPRSGKSAFLEAVKSEIDASQRITLTAKQFEEGIVKSVAATVTKRANCACLFCGKPYNVNKTQWLSAAGVCHLECGEYWSALQQRIAAGANDCPEERDAVKRWVDGQQAAKLERVCATCKVAPVQAPASFCWDCARPKRAKVAEPVQTNQWTADSGPDWEYP